jgi:hypothetical protein
LADQVIGREMHRDPAFAAANVVAIVWWYDELRQAVIRWRMSFALRANSRMACTILSWE